MECPCKAPETRSQAMCSLNSNSGIFSLIIIATYPILLLGNHREANFSLTFKWHLTYRRICTSAYAFDLESSTLECLYHRWSKTLPCHVHGLGSTLHSPFLPRSALVVLMKCLLFSFQSPQVIPFCLETAMRPWAFWK